MCFELVKEYIHYCVFNESNNDISHIAVSLVKNLLFSNFTVLLHDRNLICVCVSGEHRGLGPSISKVRSLKMDRKVWTEELIQVHTHKIYLRSYKNNSFPFFLYRIADHPFCKNS